jgi:hypothetical protein
VLLLRGSQGTAVVFERGFVEQKYLNRRLGDVGVTRMHAHNANGGRVYEASLSLTYHKRTPVLDYVGYLEWDRIG